MASIELANHAVGGKGLTTGLEAWIYRDFQAVSKQMEGWVNTIFSAVTTGALPL